VVRELRMFTREAHAFRPEFLRSKTRREARVLARQILVH